MLTIVKKNDSYDAITYQLENEDNSTVDLTGASVNFVMGKKNKLITNAKATVTSATSGIVSYQLTPSDTLVSGTFLAEFVVTFANGTMKTYPSNGYITVDVEQNLDTNQNNVVLDMIAAKQGDFEAKLNSILLQKGDINLSTMSEYTWTATEGQLLFTFPTTSNYSTSSKWFQVYVGGIPVDDSLVNRSYTNQFALTTDSANIKAGMTVHATWVEPLAPVVPSSYKIIPQQDTPPTDAVEGELWFDTSDNTYQGTVFDDLNTRVSNNETSLAESAKKVPYVTPENFGAVGDGVTDDSTAFINMYSYASTNKVSVKLTKPRYKITKQLSTNGVSTYSDCHSVLDFQIQASLYGNAFSWGGDNVTISGVVFELSNLTTETPMQGLYNGSSNVKNQRFINNNVIGKTFKADGSGNIYGVWVNASGFKNLFVENNIFENVNYAIQVNQQNGTVGDIATPLGNPIENIYIKNNTVIESAIGINTPHVYCRNVFILNNKVTCKTGFNINIAHTEKFVVDGNILDGVTNCSDSVIHIEDVSFSGVVANNIIRNNSNADGIRILLAKGISKDTYVPTESLVVAQNDIQGIIGTTGVTTRGIHIIDVSSKRISLTNNRVEGYNIGITTNSSYTDILNTKIKSCPLAISVSALTRIDGLTLEGCTEIIKANTTIEINDILLLGEIPNLRPQTMTGTLSVVVYRNVKFQYDVTIQNGTIPFNLFTLPEGKYDFNLVYRVGGGLDYSLVKLNLKWDGTTFTATKLYEMLGGALGGSTFAKSGNILTASHYRPSGNLNTNFFIDMEFVVYTSQG
jgi:hypothetical protein